MLRSWRGYLSNAELGALYGLIDAGLSFHTGSGAVTYQTWADAMGVSRRQAIRYGLRFEAAGVLNKEVRFRRGQRLDLHELNRSNVWTLRQRADSTCEDAPLDGDLADFLDATDTDNAPAALDATEADAAPRTERTQPPEPAAPVATGSSSCAPEPSASEHGSPVPSGPGCELGLDPAAVLVELQGHVELASIARPEVAARVWRVAGRYGKTLATVLACCKDAADKAAGRAGPTLESLLCGFVRKAHQEVQPVEKTAEDRRREREQAEERLRRDADAASEERRRKMAALAALAKSDRGPP